MAPPRFPIAGLVGLVALAAAAVASFRDGGSRAWDGAWLPALLVSLSSFLIALTGGLASQWLSVGAPVSTTSTEPSSA